MKKIYSQPSVEMLTLEAENLLALNSSGEVADGELNGLNFAEWV